MKNGSILSSPPARPQPASPYPRFFDHALLEPTTLKLGGRGGGRAELVEHHIELAVCRAEGGEEHGDDRRPADDNDDDLTATTTAATTMTTTTTTMTATDDDDDDDRDDDDDDDEDDSI